MYLEMIKIHMWQLLIIYNTKFIYLWYLFVRAWNVFYPLLEDENIFDFVISYYTYISSEFLACLISFYYSYIHIIFALIKNQRKVVFGNNMELLFWTKKNLFAY